MASKELSVMHRVRLGSADAHYAGALVDGAKLLHFFGDVATDLLIQSDGEEGMLRAYQAVEFLAPVYAGDFLEVEGAITAWGNTSRKMSFVARKVIAIDRAHPDSGKALVLKDPIVVCRAEGTCVVTNKK